MRQKITRGTTHRGRLHALDAALVRRCQERWRALGRTLRVVDVGIGETPETTLELQDTLREAGIDAHVTGVEIDADRVATAQAWAGSHVTFLQGGWELAPIQGPVDVIRAIEKVEMLN